MCQMQKQTQLVSHLLDTSKQTKSITNETTNIDQGILGAATT